LDDNLLSVSSSLIGSLSKGIIARGNSSSPCYDSSFVFSSWFSEGKSLNFVENFGELSAVFASLEKTSICDNLLSNLMSFFWSGSLNSIL